MSTPVPVRLAPPGADDDALREVARAAHDLAGHGVAPALHWAARIGPTLPVPGGGSTLRLWEVLATTAAHDLVLARVLEPHLDALAILGQAGVEPEPGSTWGVWAAEGRGTRLEARPGTDGDAGQWRLEGRKPWCSLAGEVSHALVTAWVDDRRRGLLAVRLDQDPVTVEPAGWSPYALAEVVTSTTAYAGARARPVGGPGWYLDRPGFAWGGLAVAAVWYGGAVGVARRLRAAAVERAPDQVGQAHLGAVDAALAAARAVLAQAAAVVDGPAAHEAPALLAARGRQVVADAVETVLTRVGHALGPGPLAHEPEHARRVADLGLYVRQHHAERDQAALGRLLLEHDPDLDPGRGQDPGRGPGEGRGSGWAW